VTDQVLAWLTSLPAWVATLVLMLLSALENVVPPVPADVAVALGAFLAQRTGRSILLLGTLCWCSNATSAVGMYVVGRRHGEAFFERGWPRRILPPAAMAALRDGFHRHGILGVFLSRFLPGLRAGVLPFAGVAGMSPARAILPALLASAIWYACIVSVASALGLSWETIRGLLDQANRVLAVVAALALVAIVVWLWRRRQPAR
jgi:membrane protein DedA with SNARE-associated domain